MEMTGQSQPDRFSGDWLAGPVHVLKPCQGSQYRGDRIGPPIEGTRKYEHVAPSFWRVAKNFA